MAKAKKSEKKVVEKFSPEVSQGGTGGQNYNIEPSFDSSPVKTKAVSNKQLIHIKIEGLLSNEVFEKRKKELMEELSESYPLERYHILVTTDNISVQLYYI